MTDAPPGPPAFCTVAPDVTPYGEAMWWVLPETAEGDGDWSAPTPFTTVAAAPGRVVPLVPSGPGSDTMPDYRWRAVGQASWYLVWIEDGGVMVHARWYRARELDCAAGGPTCTLEAPVAVSGAGTWWVRPWNLRGAGPWSEPRRFSR